MSACKHHCQQHAHCTDEVVEAQRDEVTCLGFVFFFFSSVQSLSRVLIYLWLCGVFTATHSNDIVASGVYSLVAGRRLLTVVASLVEH